MIKNSSQGKKETSDIKIATYVYPKPNQSCIFLEYETDGI